MSIDRSLLVKGPAKLTFKSSTFFSEDDFTLSVDPSTNDVSTSMHGKIDEAMHDVIAKCSFTPFGNWSALTVLFPSAYLSPTIGTRIMGDTDSPLVIASNNGDVYTLISAGITKMPTLYLGADKPIFGPIEFTGVRGNTMDASDDDSLLTVATGISYSDTTFSPANYKQQSYSAAWGSVDGFDDFQAQEGWHVEFELKLEPIKINGVGTVDFSIASCQAIAKCKPYGPTGTQILAAAQVQSAALGRRYGTGAADLVITGSGVTVTVKNAQLKTAGFMFGGKPLRNGEVGFVGTVAFSSGVASARAVLASS